MTRKSALLATETNTGRGHMVNLADCARALCNHYVIDAVAPDVPWANELLPFCRQVFAGTPLGQFVDDYKAAAGGWINPVTFGDMLVLFGFRQPDYVKRRVTWWQDLMFRQKTQVLIADFAPCALMAARSIGIPCVNAGMALTVPPVDLEHFPPMVEGEGPSPQLDEVDTLAELNKVAGAIGLSDLQNLPSVFDCDVSLPRSFPFWDPYHLWREQELLSPVRRMPPKTDGSGREVFVYFSDGSSEEENLPDALERIGLPVRAVVARRDRDLERKLSRRNITIESRPLRPAGIVERSRLLVCAGQAGTSALGLLAGLPVVAIPQYKEQLRNSRGSARLGVARVCDGARITGHNLSVEDIADTILDAFRDEDLARNALLQMDKLRPLFPEDTVGEIGSKLSPIL